MKSLIAAIVLAASVPAMAADVGVSVQISQPGVFGRIDIGRFGLPQLVLPQPVIIGRPIVAAQPVYMWVPPGHRVDWRHHCGAYGACGVPVYFVRDEWYGQHVRPYGGEPGWRRGVDRRDEHREGWRDGRRDDRREGWRDDRHEDRHEGRDHGRGDDRGGDRGRGHDRRD